MWVKGSYGWPGDVEAEIRSDLIIRTDIQHLGEQYVVQAVSMGADTIVHYSFPRHMAVPAFAARRNAMRAAAEREGIGFIELETIDPVQTVWPHASLTMFVAQDLPRQVERLGVNTAFFGTDYNMQLPLITQTIATGAIFVLTDSFLTEYLAEVLGVVTEIPTGEYDDFGAPILRRLTQSELLLAIDESVSDEGMPGRISSPAASDIGMWTMIGSMYAIEWLRGNVPRERGVIDIDTLQRLVNQHVAELGVDAYVVLNPFTHDGEIMEHYVLGFIGFHVFGRG